MKLWTPNKELHLPAPELNGFYLEVGTWDKAGYLFHQERVRSRSPVKQFLQILLSQLGETNLTITDTGGTGRTVDFDRSGVHGGADGQLNSSTRGIVIGTDDTAVDMTDTALAAQIAHGSGGGQMVHNAQEFDSDVTVSDPDCTFETYRNFNNNSGASITVKETGIYAQMPDTGGAWRFFCVVRDVPTAVAVTDGGGCYVKYTLKITE